MRFRPPGFGWVPDLPDFRDLSYSSSEARALFAAFDQLANPHTKADLREYFPPVDDQSPLHSSAAHACVSLLEYFQGRTTGAARDASRLFLYKMARRVDGLSGDSGTSVRSTLKAVKRYGIPPECEWPFDPARYDQDPAPPSLYCYGNDYNDITYIRLDRPKSSPEKTLLAVKSFLSSNIPVLFGFSVPSSISAEPHIQYRPNYDALIGGQVVLAVGYDDSAESKKSNGAHKGALLIRNSWGSSWGEGGYGWLPYSYLPEGYAKDFWTLLKPDWLELDDYLRPSVIGT